MNVFGMGWQEMMIILVGALLIFGPDRLPDVAGQIGKAVRDLRKMTSDLTGELERTAGVGDIKKAVQSELAGVKSTVDSATKGVNKSISGATATASKTVSSSTKAGGKTTTAKSTSTSVSASNKTTAAGKAAAPPKPVATKKDPLADVSFMEEMEPPAAAAGAATSNGNGVNANGSQPTGDQLDAVDRARQRRIGAGYNRRPT